ncbi:hypothetical protein [Streptomyces sp. NPDC048269]|uniref:hypothetical protein n=1 Tax=Streptomyces sp. NPDC048269 TaxID=3155753 RepID=UPI003427EFF3
MGARTGFTEFVHQGGGDFLRHVLEGDVRGIAQAAQPGQRARIRDSAAVLAC